MAVSRSELAEESLSSGVFGNGDALMKDREALYSGLVQAANRGPQPVGAWFPRLDESERAAERAFLRAILDEAVHHWNLDRGWLSEAFRAASTLEAASAISLSESQMVPKLLAPPATGSFGQAILDRLFYYIQRDGDNQRPVVVPVDSDLKTAVREGMHTLNSLVPKLANSVLPLTGLLIVVDAAFTSSYVNQTPEVAYLSWRVLGDPLMAAEYILHECLHEKYAIIRMLHPLFPQGFDDYSSQEIEIPWWPTKRLYSTARAIATLHVYIHTYTLYERAVSLDQSFGLAETVAVRRRDEAKLRAVYLSTTFQRQPDLLAQLSEGGREFLTWLSQVLPPDSANGSTYS